MFSKQFSFLFHIQLSSFKGSSADILATWMIAIGALAIAGSLILGSDVAHVAIYPKAPYSKRVDRLWFALAVSGAVLTLLGGLLLGISHHPQIITIFLIALAGYIFFHLTAAWKLRQFYKAKRADMVRNGHNEYKKQTKWIWCIVHVYIKDESRVSHIEIRP
jgi:uncharacterized integral membrane protein